VTSTRYWEDRAGILKGEITAQRAAQCFADAQALEHSGLEGTLEEGFTYCAAYHPSLGAYVQVRVFPLPDDAPAPEDGG
jgi:hypothetical protein